MGSAFGVAVPKHAPCNMSKDMQQRLVAPTYLQFGHEGLGHIAYTQTLNPQTLDQIKLSWLCFALLSPASSHEHARCPMLAKPVNSLAVRKAGVIGPFRVEDQVARGLLEAGESVVGFRVWAFKQA